jgi:hypothetical protein
LCRRRCRGGGGLVIGKFHSPLRLNGKRVEV